MSSTTSLDGIHSVFNWWNGKLEVFPKSGLLFSHVSEFDKQNSDVCNLGIRNRAVDALQQTATHRLQSTNKTNWFIATTVRSSLREWFRAMKCHDCDQLNSAWLANR